MAWRSRRFESNRLKPRRSISAWGRKRSAATPGAAVRAGSPHQSGPAVARGWEAEGGAQASPQPSSPACLLLAVLRLRSVYVGPDYLPWVTGRRSRGMRMVEKKRGGNLNRREKEKQSQSWQMRPLRQEILRQSSIGETSPLLRTRRMPAHCESGESAPMAEQAGEHRLLQRVGKCDARALVAGS
jgi:hypothetical protein